MKSVLDIIDEVFPSHFAGPTWHPWRVFLSAVYGLPVSDEDRALFTACTGRETFPTSPARESWMVIGRRGGKSRVGALLAVFSACFRRYELAKGERGIVMLIAADRRQARVVLRYIRALLHSSEMLEGLIQSERKEAIDLSNNITVEVHTASFRAVRGYTIVALIADEIAYWPVDDAVDADREILAAARPAMATVPGALLVALSSPYARKGELWRTFQERYGKDGDVLVWRAATRTMNASVPQAVIDAAYGEDASAASAEYGAEFRTDVESFISREAIDAVVVPHRLALPRVPGVWPVAFLDFAGGAPGGDSAVLAIAHSEVKSGRVIGVLDFLLEIKPPF
jgi:hypothetical protein